jgi:predicted small lipoprotein YifL
MKNLLKFIMIVSFALTLFACGRMGALEPVTDTQADSENATSSTY